MKILCSLSIFLVASIVFASVAGASDASPLPSGDTPEMRELEDQIKELSREWQSKFVEVIRKMLDKELRRLKKDEKLPRESLDRQIAKFRAGLKNGAGDARTHFALGELYDQKGDGANAIIHTRKAEQLFIEKEDIKGVAEARRRLRIYYEKYGYRPEDFDLFGK